MSVVRLASALSSAVEVVERDNLKEKHWAILKSYSCKDKKILCIEKKLLQHQRKLRKISLGRNNSRLEVKFCILTFILRANGVFLG